VAATDADDRAAAEAPTLAQARGWALNQLARRARSEAELRRTLQRRQAPGSVIEAVIEGLRRAGLVDDAAFARQWVEERALRQGYGPRRLTAELRQRGVSSEIIEAALADLDADRERDLALEAGRARSRRLSGDLTQQRRRLVAFLQRRGFHWDAVEAAVNSLLPEPETY